MTRQEMIDFIQSAETYTEIRFRAHGSKECHGIIRDLPGNPRRVTVTSTGTEFFVGSDTEMDWMEVQSTDDPLTREPVNPFRDSLNRQR